MGVTTYRKPACGTSRNALAPSRDAGIESTVIACRENPPSRQELAAPIARAGSTVRGVIRTKSTPHAELGLDDPSLTGDQFLDAMPEHPTLINRPFVVTPQGVRLCRPSELVLDLMAPPKRPSI